MCVSVCVCAYMCFLHLCFHGICVQAISCLFLGYDNLIGLTQCADYVEMYQMHWCMYMYYHGSAYIQITPQIKVFLCRHRH